MTNSHLSSLDLHERSRLTKFFGDSASFVLLKENTKVPVGRYKKLSPSGRKPRALSHKIPDSGNYGILSKAKFFILDIDIHDPTAMEKQVTFFSEFFNVDLSKTLSVITPSGGRHYYLRLPEGQTPENFFNGSLRSYKKHLALIGGDASFVDADIRSWESTGYVVGPGSYVSLGRNGVPYPTPDYYKLTDEARDFILTKTLDDLLPISEESLSVLSYLASIQGKNNKTRKAKDEILFNELEVTDASSNSKKISKKKLEEIVEVVNKTQVIQEDYVDETSKHLINTLPGNKTVKKLKHGLEKFFASEKRDGVKVPYHRKRAFVAAALFCCHSDFSIALVFDALDINRDTYSKSKLKSWELRSDIQKLRASQSSIRHTFYCEKGKKSIPTKQDKFDVPIEVKKLQWKEKVASRKISREGVMRRVDARVVNLSLVVDALLSSSKGRKYTQVVRDSVSIVDFFIQPLSNSGAMRMVLAHSAISEKLNMSKSRVSASLRLLRAEEIIYIIDRQKTGLAATYGLSESFIHQGLTKGLRGTWFKVKQNSIETPIYYDRFDGVFRQVFNNAIVSECYSNLIEKFSENIPEGEAIIELEARSGAALFYNKEAARIFGLKVIQESNETPIVYSEKTGEILTESSVLSKVRPARVRFLKGKEPLAKAKKPEFVLFKKVKIRSSSSYVKRLPRKRARARLTPDPRPPPLT